MPTLPLFDSPHDANACHRVRCPGGYEFWRFEARDQQQKLHLIVMFSLGGSPRRDYVKKTARYLNRPTRTLPPLPGDYPAVLACILEDGRQTTERRMLDASDVDASTQPTVVRFAGNSLQWDANGACRIEFHGDQMQIKLTFHSLDSLPRKQTSPDQPCHVTMTSPGSVAGSIRWIGRDVSFAGPAIYEHRFGTRPIEPSDRVIRATQTDVGTPWESKT